MYRKGVLITAFSIALFFVIVSVATLALKPDNTSVPTKEPIKEGNKVVEIEPVKKEKPVVSKKRVIKKTKKIVRSNSKVLKKTKKTTASRNKIPKNVLVKEEVTKKISSDHLFPAVNQHKIKKNKVVNKKPLIISEEKVKTVSDEVERIDVFREEPIKKASPIQKASSGRRYMPYLQPGGNLFFRGPDAASSSLDLFIPLLQWGLSDLIFTDLRVYDRSGSAIEANIHLGYRHLFSDSQQLLGIFAAFDRRKSQTGNYFNQVMVGAEYWLKRLFMGLNVYGPVGNSTRNLGGGMRLVEKPMYDKSYRSISLTKDTLQEKAIGGMDLEVGYEFIDGLVGYVGGYYFNASGVNGVYGPRAKITYDWFPDSKNVFKIFNKVGLEAGVQNDKERGTVWHVGLNLRLGFWPEKMKSLQGVSRHMVDLVHRDVDIMVGKLSENMRTREWVIKHVKNRKEFYEALKDAKIDIIDVDFDLKSIDIREIVKAGKRSPLIFIDDAIDQKYFKEMLSDSSLNEIVTFGLNTRGNISNISYALLSKEYGYRIVNSKEMLKERDCGKNAIAIPGLNGGWSCYDLYEDFSFLDRYHRNRTEDDWPEI